VTLAAHHRQGGERQPYGSERHCGQRRLKVGRPQRGHRADLDDPRVAVNSGATIRESGASISVFPCTRAYARALVLVTYLRAASPALGAETWPPCRCGNANVTPGLGWITG
jgi:hypothetical protein